MTTRILSSLFVIVSLVITMTATPILAATSIGGVDLPKRGGLAVVHGEAANDHVRTLVETGKWLVHVVSDQGPQGI